MAESEHVRLLTEGDLAAASELSAAAGWNQTTGDWRMLLGLAPDGCFAIKADGNLIATATLICYGRRLAWIGMVLTKLEYRGRGFARRLLTHALERAAERGVETVKLDATDEGQPLYEKLGFRAEQPVERWSRESSTPVANEVAISRTSDIIPCRDFEAFGADRSRVLHQFAARRAPFVNPGGFLLSRNGRMSYQLGPCVATDQGVARGLVGNCLSASDESDWCWDLLPSNRRAVALAESFGFVPERRLLRMVRGKECRGNEDLIYAIAGFELG